MPPKKKPVFSKERRIMPFVHMFKFSLIVRPMMYGFGDDPVPRNDSVELMEDLVVDYLTNIVHSTLISYFLNYFKATPSLKAQ